MIRHEESNLQQACVRWFRMQYPKLTPLLFAVPNGGARDVRTGRVLKAEGVVAGVADLLLLVPSKEYHGLCVEMKTGTGKQSESQKAWERAVRAQGYGYVVCRSVECFVGLMKGYLSGDLTLWHKENRG